MSNRRWFSKVYFTHFCKGLFKRFPCSTDYLFFISMALTHFIHMASYICILQRSKASNKISTYPGPMGFIAFIGSIPLGPICGWYCPDFWESFLCFWCRSNNNLPNSSDHTDNIFADLGVNLSLCAAHTARSR